jgi:hypothetical protein
MHREGHDTVNAAREYLRPRRGLVCRAAVVPPQVRVPLHDLP